MNQKEGRDDQNNSPEPKLNSQDELWTQILNDYENEKLHAQYIQLCWQSGHYLDATRNYQSRLQQNPEDPIARKYLKQLSLLSQYSFLKPSERAGKKVSGLMYAFDLFVIFLAVGVLLIGGVRLGGGIINHQTIHKPSLTAVIFALGILALFLIYKTIIIFSRNR